MKTPLFCILPLLTLQIVSTDYQDSVLLKEQVSANYNYGSQKLLEGFFLGYIAGYMSCEGENKIEPNFGHANSSFDRYIDGLEKENHK